MINTDYKLTGAGWSECTIKDGNKSILISASYLSDALGNLLSAALKLTNGEKKVNTSFDEEPGEYRWIFETTPNDMVNLTIFQFDELCGNKPDSDGKNIFQTECTLRELLLALFETADKIFKEHGEDGYLEKWINHDFPTKQYKDIQKWLTAK